MPEFNNKFTIHSGIVSFFEEVAAMFPLTHVLLTQALLADDQHPVVLGAIFPDLGNAIGLNRKITHEMGTGFFGFCREDHQEYLPFSQAIISHGSSPCGLDYFADDSYLGADMGYCFQRALPLVPKVIEACHLPAEMGLWKAHNFIEMAYELLTVEKYPHLTGLVKAALQNDRMISDCSSLLGQYFNIDITRIGAVISNMPDLFCLEEITPHGLAEKYARQLQHRHQCDAADPAAMALVIEEAQAIVAGEFSSFIDFNIDQVGRMLKKFPLAGV